MGAGRRLHRPLAEMLLARLDRLEECTFLESVRDCLQDLRSELSQVKKSVAVLNDFHAAYNHLPQWTFEPPPWDEQGAWEALGFEENLAGGFELRSDAPAFEPARSDEVLGRNRLLDFRYILGATSKPTELQHLCVADGLQAPYSSITHRKLWKKKRPSARTRRRRRHEQNVHEIDGGTDPGEIMSMKHTDDISDISDVEEVGVAFTTAAPVDDRWEMILPISTLTWVSNTSQSYPLKLQRSEYFTTLPANPQLLQEIEHGLERGGFYRGDWQERPLQSQPQDVDENATDNASVDAPQTEEVVIWNDAELAVWVKVTMRLAGALHRQDARLALLDARWTAAQPHVDASKLRDVETLIAEIRDAIQKWPETSS